MAWSRILPAERSRTESSERSKGSVYLRSCLHQFATSFSVARDRTKVIRNRQYPWGIPQQYLTEKERASIRLGNQCIKACLRMFRILDQYKVPYALENPASSKAWFIPQIQSHIRQQHIQFVTGDFCQFGTRWKKPTSFICGWCDPLDLTRLQRRCSGRGYCSRTGRPHVQLTGGHPSGVPMTKFAEPYPPPFALHYPIFSQPMFIQLIISLICELQFRKVWEEGQWTQKVIWNIFEAADTYFEKDGMMICEWCNLGSFTLTHVSNRPLLRPMPGLSRQMSAEKWVATA